MVASKDKKLLEMFVADRKQLEAIQSIVSLQQKALLNPVEFWAKNSMAGFNIMSAALGRGAVEAERGDRRFTDDVWENNPAFKALKQGFLTWRKQLSDWVDQQDLSEKDSKRAKLLLTTLADAVAPTNTLLGNPKALKRTLETGGTNLVAGFKNIVSDLAENDGMPSMVDKTAFKVGENLAVTPGKVIYREPHLELIQYTPQTKLVQTTPVFLVPPQINKFYIWDLSPERSVVEYLVQQGFQVFLVSWFNPTAEQADWGLQSYVEALDRASAIASEVSGSKQLHMVGACSGGITTATLLAYWKAKSTDRARSVSLLVTVLDTQDTAETAIGLMTSLELLELARAASQRIGVLEGKDLKKIFAWLRPNELIWSYWVTNYLLGDKPPAFDLLYWNSDTTCLSANLHSDFIDILEANALTKSGALYIGEYAIDLGAVDCDALVVGGTTDHITPWEGCYRTLDMLGGETSFVLSNSGHVQALVNPPTNPKASYVLNTGNHNTPEAFLSKGEKHEGTWWEHWADWLRERSDRETKAPKSHGTTEHAPICDAPGQYVLM
ncbi:MAG: alpha/beta fold hydrolase [Rhizobiaceae bacterium]